MVVIAYLMNGEELKFLEDNVTINDVKVGAAKKLNTFAPDIVVLYASTGSPSTNDHACVVTQVGTTPTLLHVIVLPFERDDDFWERAMCAHVQAQDEDGAERAVGEMSEAAREACFSTHVCSGHTNVVTLLLKAGTDVNCVNAGGISGLTAALDEGHTRVVELLLQNGARRTNGMLISASMKGNADMVEMLLKNGAKRGNASLVAGVKSGHARVVQLLLEAGADPDHSDKLGNTCLGLASSEGHAAVVDLLLKAGARSRGHPGDCSLTSAAFRGHAGVVDLLLKAGVTQRTADQGLINASGEGHAAVVHLLLNAGADVNYVDAHGDSGLRAAKSEKHTSVVDMLLRAGAVS